MGILELLNIQILFNEQCCAILLAGSNSVKEINIPANLEIIA